MHSVPGTSSIGNSNNAPVTCPTLLFVGNQCDRTKEPGNVTNVIKSGPVDIVQQRLNFVRTMREVDPHSVFIGRHWTSDYSANRVLFQNQSEKFLQNLREFIFDNHGILEDGWRVEFFYCQNRCKTFAVYCSPDGNKFESMFDVACHLGLVSNCHSLIPQNRNDGFALARNRLHLHRRRKEPLLFSRTKNLKEYQENSKSSFVGKFSSGIETMDAGNCRLRSDIRAAQANSEPAGIYGSSHCKVSYCILCCDQIQLSLSLSLSHPIHTHTPLSPNSNAVPFSFFSQVCYLSKCSSRKGFQSSLKTFLFFLWGRLIQDLPITAVARSGQ